jgi:hypothetical protein
VIEARDLTKPLPKLEIEIEIETNAEILSNPKPLQHGPPTQLSQTVHSTLLCSQIGAAGIQSLIVHSKSANLLFLKELKLSSIKDQASATNLF